MAENVLLTAISARKHRKSKTQKNKKTENQKNKNAETQKNKTNKSSDYTLLSL